MFFFGSLREASEAAAEIEPTAAETTFRRGRRVPLSVLDIPTVAVAPIKRGNRYFLIVDEGPRAQLLRGRAVAEEPESREVDP
jgi:hypothetical protein